jgi:uncharacterized protein (TIGR02145 family)
MTYTWTVGVAAAQTTSANTYAPTVAVGGATYSVTATNAAGCTSAAKTGTITVHALPTITYLSGSTAQTVTASSAITDIKYTTANASGAGISGQPSGVSGSWASNTYTVSGTPTAAGTFTYTVTTTNASGCDNASATGTIVVTQTAITYTNCTAPSLTLGAVGFTSSTTYSANGLTLSSPVTVTWCNARAYTSFDSGSTGPYKADCAQNYFSTAKGNWFSWCMVKQYESQLCPSPWRVPTPDDHCQIINGSPMDCAPNNSVITSDAGYSYTGLVINSTASNGEWQGYYWTSVEADPYTAYLLLLSYTTTTPATPYSKGYGLTLRCVQ